MYKYIYILYILIVTLFSALSSRHEKLASLVLMFQSYTDI